MWCVRDREYTRRESAPRRFRGECPFRRGRYVASERLWTRADLRALGVCSTCSRARPRSCACRVASSRKAPRHFEPDNCAAAQRHVVAGSPASVWRERRNAGGRPSCLIHSARVTSRDCAITAFDDCFQMYPARIALEVSSCCNLYTLHVLSS